MHFKRENISLSTGERVDDPVDFVLKNKIADGVVVGGGQAFVDFIKGVDQGIIIIKNDRSLEGEVPEGYYFFDGEEAVGKGKGKFPEISKLPIAFDGRLAYLLIGTNCKHGCGYCSSPFAMPGYDDEMILAAVKKIYEDGARHIMLSDNDPFFGKNSKKVLRILEIVKEEGMDFSYTTYVHPGDLTDLDAARERAKVIYWHNITEVHIAREVVSEEIGRLIGRRYYGKERSQSDLDMEKKGIKAFIDELYGFVQSAPSTKQKVQLVQLNYIVTPFETKETITRKVNEMAYFRRLSKDNLEIMINICPLTPYTGTEIRRKLIDNVACPDDFSQCSLRGNSWSSEDGPASWLIGEMVMPDKFVHGHKQIPLLRKLIKKVFALGYKPLEVGIEIPRRYFY